jgi:hypothetical protein
MNSTGPSGPPVSDGLPLPDLTDPATAPFWAAARDRRLVAQACPECAALRWPPRPLCPECLAPGGDWAALAPTGTVWSYAVYRRAMQRAFAAIVPYTVALVELDAGIRMVGRVLGPPEDVRAGLRVTAAFEPVTEDVTLVHWSPAPSGG